MGATRRFLLNSLLLSAVGVAVRFVSVSFNAHVAVKVGKECIGLFTLVTSVYSLCVIIASAGANLAVVRKVSECAAKCERDGTDPGSELRSVVRSAVIYCTLFSTVTGGAVFLFSHFISEVILGDARCDASLRALAVSLPALALCSVFAGYFTGVGKVYKNAVCTVTEETSRILVISYFLVLIAPRGIEHACLAIVAGGVVSQFVSLTLSFIIYITDKKRREKGGERGSVDIGSVARLAFPVAVGNAARYGLVTAEHLEIPRGLKRYGMTQSEALSLYGVFSGMVMPVAMFPSAVLYAFAGLLIPEIASCRAVGNFERIRHIEEKVFRSSLLFSVCTAGILISFSDGIGLGLYGSAEASRQLRLIALLVPVMYLDSAVDGMLKGLGEEVYCMRVNVLDSALCLVLVFVLVPSFGIDGFIALTIISEVVNFSLSVIRLHKVAPFRINIVKWMIYPVGAISASSFAAKLASAALPRLPLSARISLAVVLYGALCFAAGIVGRSDASWIASLAKRKERRGELSA